MKKYLSLLLVSAPALGATLTPATSPYSYQDTAEYKAIMAELKTYGEFSVKTPTDPEPVAPKTMSRGEQMVEEAKARNRAKLAEMNKAEKAKAEETAGMSELDKWKAEEKKTLQEWKKESKSILDGWKREQEIFLGRIKVYKENTFVLPVKTEKIVEKKIPVAAIPDVHIVHSAFSVPVKDQEARPTCVAFAGIRAVEMLLNQNNESKDLSEQYLYWAGKPKCQKSPCTEKGSWIREAYSFSKRQPSIDVPLETNCSYAGTSQESNETQVPLAATCLQGEVKVSGYEEARTISDVVEKLKKNMPVVVAAKLSENFYKNKGLILLKDSLSTGKKLDAHSLGHAFLAVGIIELPEALKASEGNFCIVVANSWGKGWGAGGYSCMSEKWFETYRQPSPFIALSQVTTK